MAYTKPQLSLLEKATLIIAILRALSNGLLAALTGPFRGTSGSPKYLNHIKLAILRTLLKQTTVRQLQAITPTVSEHYHAFAKKTGFAPQSITCADGTKAFWIGSPDAEKVILWFHGGGYNIPPDTEHCPFFQSLVNAAGGKVSVLMPEYTLAPHGTYPTQLREAITLVRHICTDLKRKPQDITIAGDSAGANLTLSIMSHLLHPHPDPSIPPLSLPHPLDSAILLAPWASFRTDLPSTKRNAHKDLVSPYIGNLWSTSFMGGKPRDAYSEPLSAPEGWFEGLEDVVGRVLVVGGEDEILLDVIRGMAKRLEMVHGDVRTVIAEGEGHDMPVNSLLGGGGEQSVAIRAFVATRAFGSGRLGGK